MKVISEKSSKYLLYIGIILFFLGIMLFLWNEKLTINSDINTQKISYFGNYVGGIIGSLWSLAGVILFYVALKEQRKDIKINRKTLKTQVKSLKQQIKEFELQRIELSETRKIFKEQSKTMKIQRFENTLFQLIYLHHEIIDKLSFEVKMYNKKVEKREVFYELVKELDKLFTNEAKNTKKDYNFNIEKKKIEKIFSEVFYNYSNQLLSHYFRNIYHIFKYIYKSKLIEKKNKQFYASLVRAQLSSPELTLILYNSCVSGLGYPNFLFLIKEFDIMQNYDFTIINKYNFHQQVYNDLIDKVEKEF